MALTKESIEDQTKKVAQLWVLIILVSGLISIIGPSVITVISTPRDGFCLTNEATTLQCGPIDVYGDDNGLVGFRVGFVTDYIRGMVNKTPVVDGETIVKVGPVVFWYGSYNISAKKDIPKTVFNFSRGNLTDICDKQGVFTVYCPELEVTLMKASLKWKSIEGSDEKKNESSEEPKDKKELKCNKTSIQKPIEYLGAVDFAVGFDLPSGMENTKIIKYPMFKGEQFVIAGKKVHWFGSATQYGGERFANSTFVFTNKITNESHYFDLSCPELQDGIQEIFDNHWTIVKTFAYIGVFLSIVVASGITFSVGLCMGDLLGRSAVRSML